MPWIIATVPETSTCLLAAAGLAMLGGQKCRRAKKIESPNAF
jgi:hypothetical protein